MTGRKGFVNGVFVIHVDGLRRVRFFGYSAREAEKKYREDNNLKYKRIEWRPAYY